MDEAAEPVAASDLADDGWVSPLVRLGWTKFERAVRVGFKNSVSLSDPADLQRVGCVNSVTAYLQGILLRDLLVN